MFHVNRVWSSRRAGLLILCCLALLSAPARSSAQPTVELTMEPATQAGVLPFETAGGAVKIFINITGKWKQLSWQFQGPGRFDTTEFGGIYTPPDTLPDDAEAVTIMVTAIDPQGRKASDTLAFTLTRPLPTATPSELTPTPVATFTPPPTPTATIPPLLTPTPEPTATPSPTPMLPTPTPAPVPQKSEVEEHLKKAREYLEKKWYTTPAGQNALEEYQTALTLEPANKTARKGIYDLAKKYKYWGDDEYQKANLQNAKNVYQRYLIVAEYLVKTFQDDNIRQETETIQERLKDME